MELINKFLNIVAPPTVAMTLLFFLPPYYFFKFVLSCLSSLFPEDLTHKVVIITGASSGIGEQLVYQYAKKGAFLVLIARREGSLRDVAERAMELGSPDVLVIPADVTKPEDCRRFIEATISRFGRLDHLVVNAGIAHVSLFEETEDLQHLKPVLDVNFWGSIYPTYYALRHLKGYKGRIVVTTAASGWQPLPRMSFYNASKAALINFFETLRIELGDEVGITIALPGFVESEMTKGKYILKEGRIEVDQEIRDVQVGIFPVEYADACAKAIVDSACRGDRNVTVPSWFRVMYLWRALVPEVVDWCYRMIYVTKPGMPKRILEMTGTKDVLYPSSNQTPDIKKE